MQELLELVRNGRVNCIIVKDFSRFGRNAIETGYFIERVFPLYGIRFISLSDNFDSAEHKGNTVGLEVAFKFLIHEYYSKDLSKKIRSAKQEKARRGEAVSKNCVFGYVLDEDRSMVIDPGAADTVRLIFELYSQKRSISDIEKQLYEDGRPTPAAWKKLKRGASYSTGFDYVWQKGVILSILRDERYTGVYVAGKTKTLEVGISRIKNAEEDWIRIPGHHPAIISSEQFDMVQEQLRAKSESLSKCKPSTSERYASISSPLKGKVVCGHCGHTMRMSRTKNAAFHCWFTRSISDAACHGLRVQKTELEEAVRDVILRQARTILGSHKSDAQSYTDDSKYKMQVGSLLNEKQRLYELLVLGEVTSDEYTAQKTSVDAKIERLQKLRRSIQIQTIEDVASLKAAKEALEQSNFTQELVDLLIEKVLVHPGYKIEIVWKVSGFADCLSNQAQVYNVAV